ncbi:MAG: hypothetical protein BGP01_00325 [Paludibacter sp. 47-17]|jgi:hypothetical protein|nr:MAG: hypothetical protein ABS72_01500 [Paludibacter sp. SCN 50-10]OJX90094.1 MAG: hypothetical protein BGP01_00325 [Paludibacter sp. 47-17]
MKYLIVFTVVLATFGACQPNDHDDVVPAIEMTAGTAFPTNCATVYRGESFEFNAVFTDNVELGSYSIEMHHNFDQHTHSTDAEQCTPDPVKQAVVPFRLIANYPLPSGLQRFEAKQTIFIPEDVDTGMYHFMVRLTDAAGWQIFKGISVRIADR